MPGSRSQIFLHFVWATEGRHPFLTDDVRDAAYRAIRAECHKLGLPVLAIGGIEDHVHLALVMSTTVTPARSMQAVKGVSSTIARQVAYPAPFAWQEGYGVFSFSASQVKRVQAYIDGQPDHHAKGTLWRSVEPD